MQTLEQLLSGKLTGSTHLKLSCGLTEVPPEIFSLADTLEVLDLSVNRISSLPKDFGRLHKLRIVFFSDNLFTEFPEALYDCKQLSMIGFKSNRIERIPENAIPPTTRWLILTNNKIKQLPLSIGNCLPLQKVALAGNQLSALPVEMQNCRNLELLRISANNLMELPNWLLELPKLSWLAFAGNPFCKTEAANEGALAKINWTEFEILEQLGEGASGNIYKCVWKKGLSSREVAIKVYKGEVTSDGFPEDEMKTAIAAGTHPALVNLLGQIVNHPDGKKGLVMDLIPPSYYNLGLPPSLVTCSRDTFPEGTVFGSREILNIGKTIASLAMHLHKKGLMHGDLYAHNTLIDQQTRSLMGDFGAASFYEIDHADAKCIQQIEVRAFGCLLDDLLQRLDPADHDLTVADELRKIRTELMREDKDQRPLFHEIVEKLESLDLRGKK